MNVLIGVSGGIAAYKIADLVRLFVKDGHQVKTVLTENAKYFVTPVTLETLSKNKCYTELFSSARDVEHVELGKWADIMLVAPATANIIGKIANGICDDLLSTVVLALDKPCFIFPAMNTNMLTHPAVNDNIAKLRDWGYIVYDPAEGELACGDNGKGRLPDVDLIYQVVMAETERAEIASSLSNKNVLITAGSTKSYIDPVRYIENGSSGLMGVELARQAWLRGAKVTLVCNKEVVERFPWAKYYTDMTVLVDTTEDVYKSVTGLFGSTDIYISAGALCDFKNEPRSEKIKKDGKEIVIKLKPSVDVFSELSKAKKKQLMIGFALETSDLERNAKEKLSSKGMDLVVANSVEAIDSSLSSAVIIDSKGIRKYVKESDKRIVAEEILREIEKLLDGPEQLKTKQTQEAH